MPRPKSGFLRKRARNFRRREDGVTTIEFAFIIGPFLLLMFGTLEIALVHLMRSSVSNAVEGAARPILTGTAGCATVETVKTEICNRITLRNETSCKANIKVILEELSDFNGARISPAAEFTDIEDAVDPGESESVMLLRTYFNWDIVFPLLSDALGGGDGRLLLRSTTAFRNEPYGPDSGCQA